MTGKKRRGNQLPEDAEAPEDSEIEASLRKKMSATVRELHRTERKLNSLVESKEITAENSGDIVESLDLLTEQLNDIAERLGEKISDEVENEELLIELGKMEKDARESVRFENKMVREKLSSASANLQRCDDVTNTQTGEKRSHRPYRLGRAWTEKPIAAGVLGGSAEI